MAQIKDPKVEIANLRLRAHQFVAQRKNTISDMSLQEIQHMVHELDTYQIELELQNEDLRLIQEKLDTSRKRFSDLFDFAPVGYLTISDKGLIIECNLTAADMIGEERGLLLKQSITRFIADEDQDVYYRHRADLLQSQKRQTCELRLQNKRSGLFHVQLESVVSLDVDGDNGQFRMCVTDISERKQFENLLQKHQEEWEKSFDAIADIITILDKDMNIVRANKAAHKFFDVKHGALIGEKCHKVFSGFSEPSLICPDLATLSDAANHSAEITHDILKKTFQVTTAAVIDGKRIDHIVHIAKDITEQKKLEEKLFHANKMEAIGNLAGGIAHDFNNILSAILGFAELSQFKLPADSSVRKDIDHIIVSGRRAAKLVQQILTYSRKQKVYFQPISPHLCIEEALRMLRSSLPSTIEIQEELDQECGRIMADPTTIHQIIVNLFTNALHAMEDQKGTLTIKLYCKEIGTEKTIEETQVPAGPYVVLAVTDTGCGMDRATRERIFEPFFTTKGVGKGSGMGLAVIHGIIHDLKGFVSVESVPKKGSTFFVYIPKLNTEATSLVDDPAPEKLVINASPSTCNERILVVDDEPLLVKIYKGQLEHNGYTVTTTSNSRDALEKIREHSDQFDLLITDQTMPRLSGYELSRAVLEIKPDMPIIMCTGHSDIISEEDALAMGIKKFVSKPINKDDFITTVREVLNKK